MAQGDSLGLFPAKGKAPSSRAQIKPDIIVCVGSMSTDIF